MEDYFELTEMFQNLLHECGTVDMADAEFKRMMHEDPDLRSRYRDWCHDVGSTEKRGFTDYCEDYLAHANSVWDTLKEYADE